MRACHANDHACLIPPIKEGVAAGIITFRNKGNPFAPIFLAARKYIGGMFLIPLYVESIIEKTELITTTKSIPKSLKPINNIANGIHAILGKDCSPTANELMVFPNC